MNEILWIVSLLFAFILTVISYRMFGKTGLFIWIVVVTIVSNLQTMKVVDLFGIETSLGTILYSTTFLAIDILTYKYGVKESRKTISYGFFSIIIMTIFLYISVLYRPSINDIAHDSMAVIFTFNLRITLASLIAFATSQYLDTYLFDNLQKKYGKLWLSNNASTWISQALDTIIFILIAFAGLVQGSTIVQMILSTYIFKFVIALLDTPFLYYVVKSDQR